MLLLSFSGNVNEHVFFLVASGGETQQHHQQQQQQHNRSADERHQQMIDPIIDDGARGRKERERQLIK